MKNYYSNNLNSNNLKRCYEVANARIRRFLEEEILFVLEKIEFNDIVLDLGCGYGRVSTRLLQKAKQVIGIDISEENIKLAVEQFKPSDSIDYLAMDAADLAFQDGCFDTTICVQNGISAFKIEPQRLVSEALRVTKSTGRVLISSYSEKFWNERLEWFQMQADEGLIGEIDYKLTTEGTIVCKDGFRATTFTKNDFIELASSLDVDFEINEVDNSSIVCELKKR